MLIFIDPQNNYPRFIGDINLQHPNWSVGDQLPDGWTHVEETTPPEPQSNEVVEEQFPELIDGNYKQNWALRAKTEQELLAEQAPQTARQKLKDLGLTDLEIDALIRGLR
jgi:hypothetical protein